MRISEAKDHPNYQKPQITEKKDEFVKVRENLDYIGITNTGAHRFAFYQNNFAYMVDIDPDLIESKVYEDAFKFIAEREIDLVAKHMRQKVKARFFLAQQTPKPMSAEDAIKPISHSEGGTQSSDCTQDLPKSD